MTGIVVRDNGHGMPHANSSVLFSKLGGSWKKHGSRSKVKARMLHGQAGKGRHLLWDGWSIGPARTEPLMGT